jgi:hypothetical protein
MEQSFETVTKLESAERQLRVAIRMFFERKDMIAVHALAAASLDVLRQLGEPLGFKSIYDHAEDLIREDKIQEFKDALRKAQNFFKHAWSKDPEEKLEFYYGVTQYLLFDAAMLCSSLTKRCEPEIRVFLAWFIVKFPGVYIGDDSGFRANLEATASTADPDDFKIPLGVIDFLSTQK